MAASQKTDIAALFAAAATVQGRAHVPYSKFPVGAALVTDTGAVYAGCNVENAAYPAGTCAEAGAISAMVADGGKRIAAILVLGGTKGGDLCTPCGACRQRIREFAADDCAIHIADPGGLRETFTLGELLPRSFGPDNLS